MTAPPGQIDLTLYHFSACFFCMKVRHAIAELDLDVELRDIRADESARAELIAATGRGTVPVLRIGRDGQMRWLPESSDIIEYLQQLAATSC